MSATVAARVCSVAVERALHAVEQHQTTADQVRTSATSDGVVLFTLDTLRHAADLTRRADQCMTDAVTWQQREHRALMSAYRQRCWCAARQQTAPLTAVVAPLTLAQVAADFDGAARGRPRSTPAVRRHGGCLAAHVGSNAPGQCVSHLSLETITT